MCYQPVGRCDSPSPHTVHIVLIVKCFFHIMTRTWLWCVDTDTPFVDMSYMKYNWYYRLYIFFMYESTGSFKSHLLFSWTLCNGELFIVSCESEWSRRWFVFLFLTSVKQPLACFTELISQLPLLKFLFLGVIMTWWTRLALWAWSWGCCFCRFLKWCDVLSGEQ